MALRGGAFFVSACSTSDFAGSVDPRKQHESPAESEIPGATPEDQKSKDEPNSTDFPDTPDVEDAGSNNLQEAEDDEEGASPKSSCSQKTKLKKAQFNVLFTSPVFGCPFGQGTNLPGVDAYVAARVDVARRMTEVPDDATLCSLSLKSKNTLLNFDDGLVLSLSGIALMTSHRNFPLRFKTTGKGLKKYAWQDLVLSPHLTQNTTAWCQDSEHPEASCVVPATEQTGAFDLKFLDTTVESIAEFAKDNNKPLELMLTVTGDNDAGKDCRFSPIEFTVDATYAP